MLALLQSDRDAESVSCQFLDEMFPANSSINFAVRLWDGIEWHCRAGESPLFTLRLCHPGALRRMFLPLSELSLAEAYVRGDYDIEGDITQIFPTAYEILERYSGIKGVAALWRLRHLWSLPEPAQLGERHRAALRGAPHSLARDRDAVQFHYDLSNKFYALWLDEKMVYSCAYFQDANDDLEYAQEKKLDYLCRKLRLRRGERLLDIGCGWGGLLVHAAQHYGVSAVGVTLSQAQADYARKCIEKAGLKGQCEVRLCDYRELREVEGFDKLVSVGMIEHVGERQLSTYFSQAERLLRPGGIFLCHGIATPTLQPMGRGETFILRHVFPDGELVSLPRVLLEAEQAGLEVRDVENLREHYALTLSHWLKRLEQNQNRVKAVTDEMTYRTWRLFVAGSQDGFKRGSLDLFQTLLAKADKGRCALPLTRGDWYA